MDHRIITSAGINFRIGDIVFTAREFGKGSRDFLSFPTQAMGFTLSHTDPADFTLTICREDRGWKKEQAKMVYGSLEFSSPVFIYQNRDDTWEVLWCNEQGEERLAFHCDSKWNDWLLWKQQPEVSAEEFFLRLFPLFCYGILYREGLCIHGVALEHEGSGYVISAAAGIGKSTHARLWREQENALILNGDKAMIRSIDGGFRVYGSPWYGTSGECINRSAPLKAVIFLERGNENIVRKEAAYSGGLRLLERIYAPTWDGETFGQAITMIDRLVTHVPSIRLLCRPEKEAVDVLKNGISKYV